MSAVIGRFHEYFDVAVQARPPAWAMVPSYDPPLEPPVRVLRFEEWTDGTLRCRSTGRVVAREAFSRNPESFALWLIGDTEFPS